MKITTTISVDHEVWEVIKIKYPNQASKLINNYLKELIDFDLPESDMKSSSNEVADKLQNVEIELNKLKLMKESLKASFLSKKKEEEDEDKKEWDDVGLQARALKNSGALQK